MCVCVCVCVSTCLCRSVQVCVRAQYVPVSVLWTVSHPGLYVERYTVRDAWYVHVGSCLVRDVDMDVGICFGVWRLMFGI